MNIATLIEQHSPRVALQFSGGRDSLALLLAMRPYWGALTVYYCNSGDAFPETLELVEAVRRVVPSFVEVHGNVHDVHEQLGWPSDVMQPGTHWMFPQQLGPAHVKLIDRYTCCAAVRMQPMHKQMVADGITLILRGQRNTDFPKSHVRNGEVVNGMTIAYPIAEWTTEDVDRFIDDAGIPPPPYYAAGMESAPECMHCTAWLGHGQNKYLSERHPEVLRAVNARLKKIKVTVEPHFMALVQAVEDTNE